MEGVQVIVNEDFIKNEVRKLIKSEKEFWHMEDLMEKTGKRQNWLKENILYQPRFKKELQKFTHFPNGKGDRWCFQASAMHDFLQFHFLEFFEGEDG